MCLSNVSIELAFNYMPFNKFYVPNFPDYCYLETGVIKYSCGIPMADPPGLGAAPNGRFWLSVAGLLMLLALGDLLGGQKAAEVSAHKETPAPPKFASKFMGPTIKFLYCYS